jgi:hypothetical protein
VVLVAAMKAEQEVFVDQETLFLEELFASLVYYYRCP